MAEVLCCLCRCCTQVALSATIQLDLGTTLLFSGLYNVLSGVGFQIPMCVQVSRKLLLHAM